MERDAAALLRPEDARAEESEMTMEERTARWHVLQAETMKNYVDLREYPEFELQETHSWSNDPRDMQLETYFSVDPGLFSTFPCPGDDTSADHGW